jgi:hypothetical protein
MIWAADSVLADSVQYGVGTRAESRWVDKIAEVAEVAEVAGVAEVAEVGAEEGPEEEQEEQKVDHGSCSLRVLEHTGMGLRRYMLHGEDIAVAVAVEVGKGELRTRASVVDIEGSGDPDSPREGIAGMDTT